MKFSIIKLFIILDFCRLLVVLFVFQIFGWQRCRGRIKKWFKVSDRKKAGCLNFVNNFCLYFFSICGTLHSVDQYLNIKLTDISVTDPDKYPHMLSVKNCFIRGSVVRYVQLPGDEVDTQLLQDAARKEAVVSSRWDNAVEVIPTIKSQANLLF